MSTFFAHRGASTLAPENTLAAFRLAAEHGAQWVELDVDTLADGTLVVMHDTTLDRTTNRSGSYKEWTATDLLGVDAGSWFGPEFAGEPLPTLPQCLELLAGAGVNVNVELKSPTAGGAAAERLRGGVADVLDEYEERFPGAEFLVSSFNPVLLDRFKQGRPQTRIAWLTEAGVLGEDWRAIAETLGAEAINPADRDLERGIVEEIRSYEFAVNVWTVNSRARMNELFNWGVTGVFTDRIQELSDLHK